MSAGSINAFLERQDDVVDLFGYYKYSVKTSLFLQYRYMAVEHDTATEKITGKCRFTYYDNEDLTTKVRDSTAGTIVVPLLGQIEVKGGTVNGIIDKITRSLADGYLVNPQVNIFVEEYRSKKVVVLGNVRTPGLIELSGPINFLELVFKAGGLEKDAGDTATIQRKNGAAATTVIVIDLLALIEKGDLSQNVQITDGDTVFISKAGSSIYLKKQLEIAIKSMQKMYKDQGTEELEEQESHLRDYLRTINKRRYLILTIFAIVFLATAVMTFTATPIYTAASQVLLEKNYGSKGLDYQYSYEPDFLDTQSEIIKSTNVAGKVVDNLQLAKKYHHYFFKEDGGGALITAGENFLNSMVRPVIAFLKNSPEEKSDTAKEMAVPGIEPKSDEELIAQIISDGLAVTPLKNTKIVSISYSDTDPAMARLVADAIVKAYMDEMLEIKLSTSSYSVKWMTDKAQEEREKLEYSERELQRFMRENDLVTVEDKLTVLPQKLSEFGRQISIAEAQKKELQDQLTQIQSAGKDLDRLEKIPTLATSEVLKSIRERIYKANQTLHELSKKYGPKHPQMIKVTDELRILNNEKRYEVDRILSSITNSYDLAASKEKSMKELLAQTKGEMLGSNEKFMQYQIMKREVDSNRVMYETLQAGIKKEGVTEQSQSVNIWVMKKAELPEFPSKPDTQRNLLFGMILGLLGGVGLAFFIEYLDNTVKGAQELEEKFGVPVLGSIEELRGRDKSIDLFITKNPLSPVAESYRLIRSGLLLSSAEHPPKTMLVTSMNAQEGKTSTTANIARILAQSGNSVLVIDCDLRRPRMHELFGAKSQIGLSSFLTGTTADNVVQKAMDENIFFIPSGPIPPAPAELLGSAKMKQLIDNLAEKFDFILLDSPPVQSVTDSLVLGQYVDGTIIVVRAGKTTNEEMESGMKKLRDVQTRFLGFVLNGMKNQDIGKYYYGYSTYYTKDKA